MTDWKLFLSAKMTMEINLSTTWVIERYTKELADQQGQDFQAFISEKVPDLQHKSLPGLDWSIQLALYDKEQHSCVKDRAGFYVFANFGAGSEDSRSIMAGWTATLMSETGTELESFKFEFYNFIPEKDPDTAKASDNVGDNTAFTLASIGRALHKNGSLAIRFELTIFSPLDLLACRRILKGLHTSRHHADCTIKVGAQEFAVHKGVLAEVSPVFAAMFDNNMAAAATRRATLEEDVSAEAFEIFLAATYRDYNLDFTSELEVIQDVVYLADKHRLDELREFCDDALADKVNAENALGVLVETAALCDAKKSMAACAGFLALDKEFKQTAIWMAFKEKHPNLAVDILEMIFDEMPVHRDEASTSAGVARKRKSDGVTSAKRKRPKN